MPLLQNYETDTIILKLLTGPGDDALLWFTMKLDDPFEIIMAAYCDSAVINSRFAGVKTLL